MELKFDMGMALIKAVMDHRSKFMRHSAEDPAKALKVVMSGEVHDTIMLSLAGQALSYGTVGLKSGSPLATIVGIPVEINNSVRIMDIRRQS